MSNLENVQQNEKSQPSYEPINKFLFCFGGEAYRTSCCFELFSLRTSIYIFGILDLLIGGISMFSLTSLLFRPEAGITFEDYALMIIDSLLVFAALLGLDGVQSMNMKKVTCYYYGKMVQVIFRPVFNILYEQMHCSERIHECSSKTWFIYLAILIATIAIYVYEAHSLYSYVGLVSKGEIALASKGKEDDVWSIDIFKPSTPSYINVAVQVNPICDA